MGIEKVVVGIGGLANSDDRRDLYELYNGIKIRKKFLGIIAYKKKFSAQQIKLAKVKDKKNIVLGGRFGHFHNYWEYFAMLSGKVNFILEDIKTKERKIYTLDEKSGGLLIPPNVAHKAEIERNSILIGATEEPYLGPKHNDTPYEIK